MKYKAIIRCNEDPPDLPGYWDWPDNLGDLGIVFERGDKIQDKQGSVRYVYSRTFGSDEYGLFIEYEVGRYSASLFEKRG